MLFNRMTLALISVILGLCLWSWRQSSEITSLKATNQVQAQTIDQLNKSIEQLNNQVEQERQAVEKQVKIASELRKQVEVKRENVKVILQKEPCGVTALPRPVVDELKRLHSKDKD